MPPDARRAVVMERIYIVFIHGVSQYDSNLMFYNLEFLADVRTPRLCFVLLACLFLFDREFLEQHSGVEEAVCCVLALAYVPKTL